MIMAVVLIVAMAVAALAVAGGLTWFLLAKKKPEVPTETAEAPEEEIEE